MALSSDEKKLFVANSASGTISVLDAMTLEQKEEIQVGGQPWAVQVLPGDKKAYVTDFTGGRVKVVDLERRVVTSEVTLEQPAGVDCNVQGRQWARVAERTPAQAADVVISPDGERAYVAHLQSRTMS